MVEGLMSSFTLPSGRVLELHEPTYGDEVDVALIGLKDPGEFHWAKFAVIVPEMTREEVRTLPRRDGRALALEVNRIFEERTEDQAIPLVSASPSPSTDSSPSSTTPQPSDSSTPIASDGD